MSAPAETPQRTSRARLRQLHLRAQSLQVAEERAQEDILVAIYEMKQEGVTNAAVAGMFGYSPSGIPAKAEKGAAIVAARKRRKSTP